MPTCLRVVLVFAGAKYQKFCFSGAEDRADTFSTRPSKGQNIWCTPSVLLQDRGHGKTTDRLAMTFFNAQRSQRPSPRDALVTKCPRHEMLVAQFGSDLSKQFLGFFAMQENASAAQCGFENVRNDLLISACG